MAKKLTVKYAINIVARVEEPDVLTLLARMHDLLAELKPFEGQGFVADEVLVGEWFGALEQLAAVSKRIRAYTRSNPD